MFFTDAGLGPGAGTIALCGEDGEGAETAEAVHVEGGEAAAAWVDSDDERLTISLASVNQRRKLRETEVDDFVNGHEYSRRLRRQ